MTVCIYPPLRGARADVNTYCNAYRFGARALTIKESCVMLLDPPIRLCISAGYFVTAMVFITATGLLFLAVIHAIATVYRVRLRSQKHDAVLLANGLFFVPFLFSLVFNFRERFDGRCLSGAETGEITEPLYFSYVTWTSLGYGDLFPIGFCRTVAVSESLIGYLFLAVLAARFYAELTERTIRPEDD